MHINFNDYLNHGTGYIIKTVYPKNGELITDTLVSGYSQVIPETKPMEENCYFDIASLTKFFTSILIHLSVQNSLIKLDDSIKSLDDRFIYLDDITIRDLVSHKIEIWTDGYLGNATSKEDFYRMLFNSKIKSKKRTYVDAHYMILSIILEKIYNMSFAKIANEKILKVLDLKDTSFTCPNLNRAVSCNYEVVNGEVIDYIKPGTAHDTKARIAASLGISVGHAGIFTTANDLIKLLTSFIDCEYKLLSEDSITRMLSYDDAIPDLFNNLFEIAKEKNISLTYANDINLAYEELITKTDNKEELYSKIIRPYNYGGTRYKHPILKRNEIPEHASNKTIIFSGFTGPIFLIDFEKRIIILIMTNTCHNSQLSKSQRYLLSQKMISEIYNNINQEAM